jgi:transposase
MLKKQLKRDQVAGFLVNLPAPLIGMQACERVRHWARCGLGRNVRLIAPQFVKPRVRTNKSDAADAADARRRSATRGHGTTGAS